MPRHFNLWSAIANHLNMLSFLGALLNQPSFKKLLDPFEKYNKISYKSFIDCSCPRMIRMDMGD